MPIRWKYPHLIWKCSTEPEHNTIIMYMPTHTYMLLAEGLYYRRTIQFKNRDWGDLLIRGWNWTKGPSLYYVIILLAFLDPTHPPYQHKYSTERQQNCPFSRNLDPLTQSICWRNIGMAPREEILTKDIWITAEAKFY